METLKELLKKLLADTFAMYLKAHNFHWNVEGINFVQYHDFFGDLYKELHSSVDQIAEELRKLDSYAPGSLKRFQEITEIEDELNIPTSIEMVEKLLSDNQKLINTLSICFKLADQFDKQGLADFIASRIDAHEKHGWMLRSILK
jgi:starvation-inducible DNA-binding protein